MECAPEAPLITKSVAKRDRVPSKAQDLVEARDDSHCFMLDQKPSDSNISVRFDYAWVVPPSLFDDSDMDPQVSSCWASLYCN